MENRQFSWRNKLFAIFKMFFFLKQKNLYKSRTFRTVSILPDL